MISHQRSTKWIDNLNSIFNECGVGDLSTIDENDANYISKIVERTLEDQFIQLWHNNVANSSKCQTLYRHIKTEFKQDNYLVKLPESLRVAVCKFRTSNHRLPIEEGRYINVDRNIRLCRLCDQNNIGDEYHLVIECKNQKIKSLRQKYLHGYYITRPSMYKFVQLVKKEGKQLFNLARFLNKAFQIYH